MGESSQLIIVLAVITLAVLWVMVKIIRFILRKEARDCCGCPISDKCTKTAKDKTRCRAE